MKKPKAARRHHYLPQCYLSGFTDTGTKVGKFYVLDMSTGKGFRSSPNGVAHERDFNRVEIDGFSIDALEKGFSKFESEVAESLRKIRENRVFPDENDCNNIINLMSLIAIRNPTFRAVRASAYAQSARMIASIMMDSKERYEQTVRNAREAGYVSGPEIPYEEMKSFIDAGDERYKIETPLEQHHRDELKLHDSLIHTLGQRTWSLLVSDSESFICCDRPVALTHKSNIQGSHIGLGSKHTEIVFPLSASIAFYGVYEDSINREVHLERARVASINTKIVRAGESQIYSRESNFLILTKEGLCECEIITKTS